MCGIIGLIDYNNEIDSNSISKMINSIHQEALMVQIFYQKINIFF